MQKLHLLCANDNDTANTWLHYVLLTKDYVVATNSHALVAHKTDKIFDKVFSEKISGEEKFYIHKNQWKKLCKKKIVRYTFNKDNMTITGYSDKNEALEVIPVVKDDEAIYPNWQGILPPEGSKFVDINYLGINPEWLYNLQQAIYPEIGKDDYCPLFLKFYKCDENKMANGIMVVESEDDYYENENFKAVIMPMRKINQYY